VSLILDALKKLERERDAPERGFLVVAQQSWPSGAARRWTRPAGWLAAAVVAGGAASAAFLWPGRQAVSLARAPSASTSVAPLGGGDGLVAGRSASAGPAGSAVAGTVPPQAGAAFPEVRSPTAAASADAPAPGGSATETTAAKPHATDVADALQLQAVSEQDGQPVAVVNGQLVRVGDRIGSATVVRISATEVELDTAGRRHVLKF
jgi:hypothetical protein